MGDDALTKGGDDSFILSHHPAKFGSHGPRENEDITFFISHVTTVSNCHMTSWVVWGAPILIGLTEVKMISASIVPNHPSRRSHRRCSVKEVVLKNFSKYKGEHLRWGLFLIKVSY